MVLLSSVFLFTECVPCGRTNSVTVETCEINPDEGQYCVIACEIHATSTVCSLDCWNTVVYPCRNITSDHFQMCCITPYCNNLTEIPRLPSSTLPGPLPSKLVYIVVRTTAPSV